MGRILELQRTAFHGIRKRLRMTWKRSEIWVRDYPAVGILHSILAKESEAGGNVTSNCLTSCAPSHFGMMSVVFDVYRKL